MNDTPQQQAANASDAPTSGMTMEEKANPEINPETAELYQQKASELQELVAQQVMQADTSKPTTMTEMLADDQGAFAAKAQELGMAQEWETFKSQQPQIGKLREEFMSVQEELQSGANRVANMSPEIEKEEAATRKAGKRFGIAGAAVSGAASAYGASKATQSNPLRIAAAAAGAVFGGAVAAIFGAKKRAKKGMDKIQEQVGDLGNIEPNPELEKKAAELQGQLGLAQQESMESMVEAMVDRMTEKDLAAQKAQEAAMAHQAQQAQEAEMAAQQQAAAPEQPAPQPEAPQQAAAATEAQAREQAEALLDQLQQAQGTPEQGVERPAQSAEQPQAEQPTPRADAIKAERAQAAQRDKENSGPSL